MATFSIKNSNSVLTGAGHAFSDDSAAVADTLTVDQSGFLITTGALGYGARLAATKAWKVTVNGIVTSTTFYGIGLLENNTDKSTITIGTEGEVFGSAAGGGVYLGSAATLTNSGVIVGGAGVLIGGAGVHTIVNKGLITGTAGSPFGIRDFNGISDDVVTNSGGIEGVIDLGGGKNKITNTGAMDDVILGDGDDTITTSNMMFQITLGNGANTVTNSGTIFGDVTGGTGVDKITNSKDLIGNVDLDDGVNTFTNSGTLQGDVTAAAGSSNTITNSKTINGSVLLGNGADIVKNSGTITTLDLGDGVNVLTNSGTIDTLMGGSGNDTITNSGAGSIGNVGDLGAGDDKYTGGSKYDSIDDSAGADTISLGGGDDGYYATGAMADGLDKIDGGAGVDVYVATGSERVFINIDTVSHTAAAIGSIDPQYTVGKNLALGIDIGSGDTVLNFENIYTGTNNDVIHGNAAANEIQSGAGADIVIGYGGNDEINAGDGADTISGGLGRDTLSGGFQDNDADLFVYGDIKDSTVGRAGRDVIESFEDGFDRIDLFAIDAVSATKNGNETFSFVGANAKFTAAGQVRVLTTATGYAVEADVTGDGKADFAIDIADPTHAITWTSADFIL
jgi:hypothetical protein